MKKEFMNLISELSNRHQTWQVFSDFCEMSAISLSNSIAMNEQRENRYLEIVKRYSKDELQKFPQMFAYVVNGLEGIDCDFLGECFQELELSSHWKGQFFTPSHLCKAMAEAMTLDAKEFINRKGFFTVSDPACGAGATLIWLAASLHEREINYQQCMHVTAQDVDRTAAHMCYVQLSLLNIPAVVIIGNTLTLEITDKLFTPAHYLGFWGNKLRRGYLLEKEPQNVDIVEPIPEVKKSVDVEVKNLKDQLVFNF